MSSVRMDGTGFVFTVSLSNSEAWHSGIDLSQDIKAMQSDTSMVRYFTGGDDPSDSTESALAYSELTAPDPKSRV